jgi:hypothetical protein
MDPHLKSAADIDWLIREHDVSGVETLEAT